MKHNVIPRKATKLAVTFNRETSHHKAGDTVIATKDPDRGYWTDGRCWMPGALLRNPEVCSLEVIE